MQAITTGLGGLMLLAVLAGCNDQGDRPPRPVKADRVACEAEGGTYTPVGLLQTWACVMPTPDAGKVCTSSAQCVAGCLADDMVGHGNCAPVTPMFGCMIVVEDENNRYEICID